jgi:protein-disulfide isomerase
MSGMPKNMLPLLGVVLLSVVITHASSTAVADQSTTAKKAAAKAQPLSIPAERASGRKDAPIVIEVFTDFQCPGCREFYLQTLTRVIEDYCSKGKVYLIHRECPLNRPDHRYSRDAARWALACAGLGKYELAAAALFRDQAIWEKSGNIEATMASVLSPAELQKVKRAMKDSADTIESVLQRDIFIGNQFPIRGTPAFRILVHGTEAYAAHGEPGNPWPSYSILKRYLDEKLAK